MANLLIAQLIKELTAIKNKDLGFTTEKFCLDLLDHLRTVRVLNDATKNLFEVKE